MGFESWSSCLEAGVLAQGEMWIRSIGSQVLE